MGVLNTFLEMKGQFGDIFLAQPVSHLIRCAQKYSNDALEYKAKYKDLSKAGCGLIPSSITMILLAPLWASSQINEIFCFSPLFVKINLIHLQQAVCVVKVCFSVHGHRLQVWCCLLRVELCTEMFSSKFYDKVF